MALIKEEVAITNSKQKIFLKRQAHPEFSFQNE
jgi:hypothetical protein